MCNCGAENETFVCRCEEVTREEILAAIADGATTVAGVKKTDSGRYGPVPRQNLPPDHQSDAEPGRCPPCGGCPAAYLPASGENGSD